MTESAGSSRSEIRSKISKWGTEYSQRVRSLRGAVETADGRYDILQQTGRRDGAIIVPVDDSGTLLAFDPATPGKGYQLSIHMVGQTDLYGTYDKVPSPRQIAAILDGKDP